MVVLKGVPALLSPELLYALARMGHGDEIVLADVNFPTSSICRCGPEEIRADGLGIPQLLEAMLKLLPLDTYVEKPAVVMELVPSDRERGLQTPVWRSYQSILLGAGCAGASVGCCACCVRRGRFCCWAGLHRVAAAHWCVVRGCFQFFLTAGPLMILVTRINVMGAPTPSPGSPAGCPAAQPGSDTTCLRMRQIPQVHGSVSQDCPQHRPSSRCQSQVQVVTWASDQLAVDRGLPRPLPGLD
ncbi:fucose mutarotase isoform X2 [Camelus ferus]|uniref:L-fucose mutarotase n=1 Tax=Camelus ferus TaxID=419612 RepID=A0A8B8TVY7_CAMFR|nr:fucose mutarotase isoform X2 [Camelus ferus]